MEVTVGVRMDTHHLSKDTMDDMRDVMIDVKRTKKNMQKETWNPTTLFNQQNMEKIITKRMCRSLIFYEGNHLNPLHCIIEFTHQTVFERHRS